VVPVPGHMPVQQKLSYYIITYLNFFKIIFIILLGWPYQAFAAVLLGLSEAPEPSYPTDAMAGLLAQSGLCRPRHYQLAPRHCHRKPHCEVKPHRTRNGRIMRGNLPPPR
jgi:hypothetical protein